MRALKKVEISFALSPSIYGFSSTQVNPQRVEMRERSKDLPCYCNNINTSTIYIISSSFIIIIIYR